MTDRWWAPTRATADPDAVVLVLLQPSGQPAGDLGATLLGAHRAGAAAVETVAKSAVPSEVGLVRSISSSRERVSGLVVDAAAASMEKVYAGLFVRDFFDDAEQGALDLYRVAVAKGVSPPLAASRVGAVYGVPFHHLGKYAALATDPKASQVALTDAADRALLSYVAKVVDTETEEVEQVKELVSKAPATQTQTELEFDPRYHPRDAWGRFVEVEDETTFRDPEFKDRPAVADPTLAARARTLFGAGLQAAPEVAAKPKTRQVKRTRRPKRRQMVATQAGTKASVRPAKASLSHAQITQLNVQAATQLKTKAEAGTPPSPGKPGDALKMVPDTGTYYPNDVERAFFLTATQDRNLRAIMGGPTDQRIFRMHYLSEQAGLAFEPDSPEARHAQKHLADINHQDDYGMPELPVDPVVRPLDFGQAARRGLEPVVYTEEQIQTLDAETGERSYVRVAKDYEDRQTDLLVYIPPPVGRLATMEDINRPLPMMHEYFIEHSLEGRLDSGATIRGFADFKLDPNKAYMLTDDSRLFYDKKKKIFVNRTKIVPVDEEQVTGLQRKRGYGGPDVGKALDTQHRVSFNQLHPRNQDGQFVDTADRQTLTAPTAAQPLVETTLAERAKLAFGETKPEPMVSRKIKRTKRTKRRRFPVTTTYSTEVALPTKTQPATATSQAARTRLATAVMTKIKAKVKVTPPENPLPALDDSMEYRVMSQDKFSSITSDPIVRYLVPPNTDVNVNTMGRVKLKEWSPLGSDEVVPLVQEQVLDQIVDQSIHVGEATPDALTGLKRFTVDVENDSTINAMFDYANGLLDKGAAWVEMREEEGYGGRSWVVQHNQLPIQDVVLIQTDPYADDWDNPNVALRYLGTHTVRDLITTDDNLPRREKLKGLETTGGILNAKVAMYKATVIRYQDEGDPDPPYPR